MPLTLTQLDIGPAPDVPPFRMVSTHECCGGRCSCEVETLVAAHVCLVRRCARLNRWSDAEVLSAGYDGLLAAAKNYDPAVGSFSNFAWVRIRGAMLNAQYGERRLRATLRWREVTAARHQLEQQHQRAITASEIAATLQIPLQEYWARRDARAPDIPVTPDIPDPTDIAQTTEVSDRDTHVHTAIQQLPPTLQHVIRWYFFDALSYKSIGERLHRSERSARKLVHRALMALRKNPQLRAAYVD